MRWLGTALLLLAGLAGPAGAAGPSVEYREDRVTARFEDTPVPEALAAIQRATGIEIVLPGPAAERRLTLAADGQRLEPFLRRVLAALDYGGFALVFEGTGRGGRLLVVDRGSAGPPPPPAAPPAPPATAGGPTYVPGAEPVYIPPATPPVYIPPESPPVYIPPKEPPVYIPPATPPVYVPPAAAPGP
jgi:hypothetical protein